MRGLVAILAALLAHPEPAAAALDLGRASVERLENGLTLILLEEHTFPIVSVQTAYRTGAKDDPAGRLGLAHFFEHMAFRGSKNFPDTGLVSDIYAAGGEWHGYTWIDLTTYFATTPRQDLPLLLAIEADRMARLDVRAEDVEAERGAVLAEMNGYANDPDSTLFDALIAAHFQTHPYRNNTIGYETDIRAIGHADLLAFFEERYAPQNAVLAIVGDFDRDEVRGAMRKKFAKIRKPETPRTPLTAEAPRTGERRVDIALPAGRSLFKIAYPAPAASSPDFPAFLVLQALVGQSNGVNFNNNDWGTPVGDASPLAEIANDLRSWIIPTAEPYVFVVSGDIDDDKASQARRAAIEKKLQTVFDDLAAVAVSSTRIADAKAKMSVALALDLQTTEDAAHQLAYFAGIGAFDALLSLQANINAVTADDVSRIARTYLRRDQRTIAWLTPGPPPARETPVAPPSPPAPRPGAPSAEAAAPPPVAIGDDGATPIVLQTSRLSPTIAVKAVMSGRFDCALCAIDTPAFGITSVSLTKPAEDAQEAFLAIRSAIAAAEPAAVAPASDDPLTRLEEYFASLVEAPTPAPAIALLAISGDVETDAAKDLAGPLTARPTPAIAPARYAAPEGDITLTIAAPKAQAAVGFVALAPAATTEASLAMRIALYVLSHGYEGRLGKEAIARRGLAYYIEALYRADSGGGLATLAAGVDPDKLDAFSALLRAEVDRLADHPPSPAEIVEAKRHMLGRKVSAAQSNAEIADALAADYLASGGPESQQALAARLDLVSREDVVNAAAALKKGAVVRVTTGGLQ